MNLTLKMAYLNMWRRKSRSLAVIMMIAVSVAGLLLIQGIYDGMVKQMINNLIRSDSSDITIYGKNYKESKSLKDSIKNPQEIERFLENNQAVKSFIKRIKHDGLIATASHSQSALIIGTELEKEQKHANLSNYLIDGEYSFGEKNKEAIIGSELADKLKLKVGKKIVFTAQNKSGEIVSLLLKVGGIVKTNDVNIDKSAVIVDYQTVENFLALKNSTTQISIALGSKENLAGFKENLVKEFGKRVDIFAWSDIFPMFLDMEEMIIVFNIVSYGLVFLVVSIGIFGVILVCVLERIREFGIMLALGNSFFNVSKLIVLESIFLGFLGLGTGFLIGGGLLAYFNVYGMDLSSYAKGLSMWGMDSVMYAEIKFAYFIQAFLSVFFATVFAALWPVKVLKKFRPIEAINSRG